MMTISGTTCSWRKHWKQNLSLFRAFVASDLETISLEFILAEEGELCMPQGNRDLSATTRGVRTPLARLTAVASALSRVEMLSSTHQGKRKRQDLASAMGVSAKGMKAMRRIKVVPPQAPSLVIDEESSPHIGLPTPPDDLEGLGVLEAPVAQKEQAAVANVHLPPSPASKGKGKLDFPTQQLLGASDESDSEAKDNSHDSNSESDGSHGTEIMEESFQDAGACSVAKDDVVTFAPASFDLIHTMSPLPLPPPIPSAGEEEGVEPRSQVAVEALVATPCGSAPTEIEAGVPLSDSCASVPSMAVVVLISPAPPAPQELATKMQSNQTTATAPFVQTGIERADSRLPVTDPFLVQLRDASQRGPVSGEVRGDQSSAIDGGFVISRLPDDCFFLRSEGLERVLDSAVLFSGVEQRHLPTLHGVFQRRPSTFARLGDSFMRPYMLNAFGDLLARVSDLSSPKASVADVRAVRSVLPELQHNKLEVGWLGDYLAQLEIQMKERVAAELEEIDSAIRESSVLAEKSRRALKRAEGVFIEAKSVVSRLRERKADLEFRSDLIGSE